MAKLGVNIFGLTNVNRCRALAITRGCILIHFQGMVVSGRNRSAALIASISDNIHPFLGGVPFKGSLNVVLSRPLEFDPSAMVLCDGNRLFWQIELNSLPCLTCRWQGCPLHVIEVISDHRLRAYFSLSDGDNVTIKIPRQSLSNLSLDRRLVWLALWRFRSSHFYKSDRYHKWVRRTGRLGKLAGQRL